jgi:hypothetical protein
MQGLRSDAGIELVTPDRTLSSSHQRVTRVSVLDDLYNPLPGAVLTGEDGYVLDGSVTSDEARSVARSLTLSIVNPQGVWTPTGPGSLLYWDRLLRVERGVRVGGVDYVAPLGVFLIDEPQSDNDGSGHVLTIKGADRMDRAIRSEFTAPTTYAAGTRVGVVIQDILTDAGVGSERWIIDDGGATLGAVRAYEVGEERLSAAMTLATSFALLVRADANGYMTVTPKVDPTTLTPAWTFAAGDSAVHEGISKRWSRARFYNHILVTGESADQTPVRAEASDTNPSSPTRVTGPMGDRLYKYTSAMITTVPQAQATANALLWEHALIEETIRVAHVALPMFELGDAISVNDAVSATDSKYVIDAMTIPLAAGAASLDVKMARRLN